MDEITVKVKPESVSYEDIRKVMQSAHETARGNGLEFPTSELSAEEMKSRVESSGIFFVALRDDKLVGTLAVTKENIQRWYTGNVTVAFRYVAVLPEYSGQHIAGRLYQAGFEYAKSIGADTCLMTMSEYNRHHLHVALKNGFRKVDYISYSGLANNSIRVVCWMEGGHSSVYCSLRYNIKRCYVTGKKAISRKLFG